MYFWKIEWKYRFDTLRIENENDQERKRIWLRGTYRWKFKSFASGRLYEFKALSILRKKNVMLSYRRPYWRLNTPFPVLQSWSRCPLPPPTALPDVRIPKTPISRGAVLPLVAWHLPVGFHRAPEERSASAPPPRDWCRRDWGPVGGAAGSRLPSCPASSTASLSCTGNREKMDKKIDKKNYHGIFFSKGLTK